MSARRPLISAGALLGMGLGGFVDGILLHQILQVHGMLTARLPKDSVAAVEINMFWDGIFHAFTWLLTVLGVALLFRAARRDPDPSTRTFVGALLLGYGAFNTVEGFVDHFVLHLHHVVERLGPSMWDVVFLASGLLMLVVGTALVRSAAPTRHASRSDDPRERHRP
jgi:uncharacterized membrane protein